MTRIYVHNRRKLMTVEDLFIDVIFFGKAIIIATRIKGADHW